jgi:hypothetical protein
VNRAKVHENARKIAEFLRSSRRFHRRVELEHKCGISPSSVSRAVSTLKKLGLVVERDKKVAWVEYKLRPGEYEMLLDHSKKLLLIDKGWCSPSIGLLKRAKCWEYVASHLQEEHEFRGLYENSTRINHELELCREKLRRIIIEQAKRLGLKPVKRPEELESEGAVLVDGILYKLLDEINLALPVRPTRSSGEGFLDKLLQWFLNILLGKPKEIRNGGMLIGYPEFVSSLKVQELVDCIIESYQHQIARIRKTMYKLASELEEVTREIDEYLEKTARKVYHGRPLPGYCDLCPRRVRERSSREPTNSQTYRPPIPITY